MSFGLLARIEAKPEHANEIAALLTGAGQLAQNEGYARTWHAYQVGPTTFGVFDTFDDEQSRAGHLHGHIAAALTDLQQQNKLAAALDIRPVNLLSAVPGADA
jgi:hypothetical protein